MVCTEPTYFTPTKFLICHLSTSSWNGQFYGKLSRDYCCISGNSLKNKQQQQKTLPWPHVNTQMLLGLIFFPFPFHEFWYCYFGSLPLFYITTLLHGHFSISLDCCIATFLYHYIATSSLLYITTLLQCYFVVRLDILPHSQVSSKYVLQWR